MAKLSKRNKKIGELVKKRDYDVAEAVAILKKAPKTKFESTVEIAMKLTLDQSSNPIRGTVSLPHGTGKGVKVAVFCKGAHEKAAKDAGADYVGSDDLVKKVADGWVDFDVAVSTPDMMKDLAKLGKVLGPRGLMPNPKAGTVTTDIGRAVQEVKAGKIEFRMDKQSGINAPVGKISFEDKNLVENIESFVEAIINSSPKLARGQHIKSIALSSTMGPGVKLEKAQFVK